MDNLGRVIPALDCIEPGRYIVEVTNPTATGVGYTWSIGGIPDPTQTGSNFSLNISAGEEKTISVNVEHGNCNASNGITVTGCGKKDEEKTPPATTPPQRDVSLSCLLFKALALLGLGLIFLGGVLLLCPAIGMPFFPPPIAASIGLGLIVGGGVLLGLGLLLWTLICQPDSCDWFGFLWQSLNLIGLVMIYAGFCPVCSWLLLGIIPLLVGFILVIVWARNCNISRCGVLAEMISLFTIAVNVTVVLEMILAACVITSRPIASIIWGLAISAIQAGLWYQFNRSNCIRR